MKIAAGIVTYCPNIERLKKNILAINNQVDMIIIADNGSANLNLIEELVMDMELGNTVNIISNKKNMGIAHALNQIMHYAYKDGADYVVTLDEDSVCPKGYVECAKQYMDSDVAMIVPLLKETESGEMCLLGTKVSGECQELNKCITSAAITNVKIWKKVRGFDGSMFIDYVDYDYATKCRINGYKILRLNNMILDHHIGKSEMKNIFGFKVRVANHSAFRKFYIGRNIVIYIRRYKHNINVFAEILRLFKVFALIVLFEKDKRRKLSAFFKGIVAGIKYKKI